MDNIEIESEDYVAMRNAYPRLKPSLMMNAEDTTKNIATFIEDELGLERKEKKSEVGSGSFWIGFFGNSPCYVICSKEDAEVVKSITRLFSDDPMFRKVFGYAEGIDIKVMTPFAKRGRWRRRTPRKIGDGFGANMWRYSTGKDNRTILELSFGCKPDEKTREELKKRGFKWNPTLGVWYVTDKIVSNAKWATDVLRMGAKQ